MFFLDVNKYQSESSPSDCRKDKKAMDSNHRFIEITKEHVNLTDDRKLFDPISKEHLNLSIMSLVKLKEVCAHKDPKLLEVLSSPSDLIDNKYEGGFKTWESTFDLITYFHSKSLNFRGLKVLDLGCGAGILGMYALLNGAVSVHFQDFNEEVINYCTMPNVIKNCGDKLSKRCKFSSGDWVHFSKSVSSIFDLIVSSETMYNENNFPKLFEILKQNLSTSGHAIFGGKLYYFGVGGGTKPFKDFIESFQEFQCSKVFRVDQGVSREIIMIELKGL